MILILSLTVAIRTKVLEVQDVITVLPREELRLHLVVYLMTCDNRMDSPPTSILRIGLHVTKWVTCMLIAVL